MSILSPPSCTTPPPSDPFLAYSTRSWRKREKPGVKKCEKRRHWVSVVISSFESVHWCWVQRWLFWTGLWGEDLRSTSGLELGARTLLVGVYSLTNGAWPMASRDSSSRPEVDLRLTWGLLPTVPFKESTSGTNCPKGANSVAVLRV